VLPIVLAVQEAHQSLSSILANPPWMLQVASTTLHTNININTNTSGAGAGARPLFKRATSHINNRNKGYSGIAHIDAYGDHNRMRQSSVTFLITM
jgi:hypothetical protein